MSAPLELSLVVPVYNERDNLPILVEEIGRALAGRGEEGRYEIVAVDDGSTDGSLDVLKALKREHPEIHIVAFAANAGQTAAFAAGFGAARGRVIVTLDADLQNDPPTFPCCWRSSSAAGRRRSRGAGWIGRTRAGSGCKAGSPMVCATGSTVRRFAIPAAPSRRFRAEALRALPLFNGMHRFLPTLVRMRGGG